MQEILIPGQTVDLWADPYITFALTYFFFFVLQ